MIHRAKRILLVLLFLHGSLLAYSAYVQSPTYNESAHLAAGLIHLKFGRFDAYGVNPPLVRSVAACPVAIVRYKEDWRSFRTGPGERPEMRLGEDFVAANGSRSIWLMTLARWACLPFSLIGAYFCWRWARDLYGQKSALFAAALWCFSPNVIGHGSLITADIPAAALGLAACYTFWCWLRKPTWSQSFVAGITLGIAELTKTTFVVLWLLWPVLWLIYRLASYREIIAARWLREIGMLIAFTVLSLLVLNMGYVFEGTLRPLGDFDFVSRALSGDAQPTREGLNRFSDFWLGDIPVPLPSSYVTGIDLQRRDFESYGSRAYLNGEFRETGRWDYYLFGLAVKLPIGTLVLIFLAITPNLTRTGASLLVRVFRPVCYRQPEGVREGQLPDPTEAAAPRESNFVDQIILLSPAIVILTLVSSQTGINEHVRYAFPVLPYVYVRISQLARKIQRNVLGCLIVLSLSLSVVSSLQCYPHSASYFNELVGGPMMGHKHLIHSNIDWGQDLLYFREWMEAHPLARPMSLAYFGGFDPTDVGVKFDPPDLKEGSHSVTFPPGWYAVSVQLLKDSRSFPVGSGGRAEIHPKIMEQMMKWRPTSRVGYSIRVYHIDKSKTIQTDFD